ncbi:VanZ family protein [Clostridium sp. 1001271B_151109_B4]|uniref:VanZ family protein n=1 Tax=Clostridium sp. 1001271B_151109_B4 TaxID=2787148 RepID=UPI0018A94F52|nr:VanZ family protein [Clostridium sp. 1001271B_151109_B4]
MKKKLSIVLCILWMGFIFYNSSQPGNQSNEKSTKVLNMIKEFKDDTLDMIRKIMNGNNSSSLNGYIVYNESTRKIVNPNSTINWGKCNEEEISNIFITYDNSESYDSIELCGINSEKVAYNKIASNGIKINKVSLESNDILKNRRISINKSDIKNLLIKVSDKIKAFVYEHFNNFNVFVRKCAHAFEFSVLAILLLWAMSCHGIKGMKSVIFALLIVFFYAMTDEFHQLFVPGRGANINDVMIDFIGGIIGSVLYTCISWLCNFKVSAFERV